MLYDIYSSIIKGINCTASEDPCKYMISTHIHYTMYTVQFLLPTVQFLLPTVQFLLPILYCYLMIRITITQEYKT